MKRSRSNHSGLLRAVLHDPRVERERERSERHRRAGMARLRLLDGVHRQRPDRVDGELDECRPWWSSFDSFGSRGLRQVSIAIARNLQGGEHARRRSRRRRRRPRRARWSRASRGPGARGRPPRGRRGRGRGARRARARRRSRAARARRRSRRSRCPTPSMRAKFSIRSSASGSPSSAAATSSRPETLPSAPSRLASALSGLSRGQLGGVALERLAGAVGLEAAAVGAVPRARRAVRVDRHVAELGAETVRARGRSGRRSRRRRPRPCRA